MNKHAWMCFVTAMVTVEAARAQGCPVDLLTATGEVPTQWLTTCTQPGNGWNSDPSFSTEGWSAPFGRTTIWCEGPECNGPASYHTWARRVVEVPPFLGRAQGRLEFVVDDDAEIYINGVRVYNDDSGQAEPALTVVQIGEYLGPGSNVIAVHATDDRGTCRRLGVSVYMVRPPHAPEIRPNSGVCASGRTVLEAVPAEPGSHEYRWEIEMPPNSDRYEIIADGHFRDVSSGIEFEAAGAGSARLGLSGLRLGNWVGPLRIVAVTTNACGSAGSAPFSLPVCLADFTCDGFLDFFDYDLYVDCFERGICPSGLTADFNGDSFVDFFDYDTFVSVFEGGC